MRKALIVGTSNSIMKGGWVEGFKEAYAGETDRLVIGGSPFWQFLGKLGADQIEGYDDIVVDSAPNDESHGDQIGNIWIFENLYRDFLLALTAAARVTILRIPSENFIDAPPNKISIAQRRVCNQVNAEYFDISSTLLARSPGDRYFDRLHPKVEVMFEIGANLASRLSSVPTPISSSREMIATGYFEEHLTGAGIDVEVVETSIIKARFTVLKDGQQARLSAPKLCFGFFANLQNCNATIRLDGPNDRVDLSCHFERRHKPTVSFVTIKGGFILSAVSVVKPWHSKNYAMHSLIEQGPYVASIGPFLCYER